MKSLRRYTVVFLLVLLAALAGCKSIIEINNSTDPEDFDPFEIEPTGTNFYDEISIDVPDDIQKDDYEITDVDIFADVVADSLAGATLAVKLYVGLKPGETNLANTAINELIATAELIEQGKVIKISVRNSKLIFKAFDQETFWMKATVEWNIPTTATVRVKNVYVDMTVERETGGLLPIFYLF